MKLTLSSSPGRLRVTVGLMLAGLMLAGVGSQVVRGAGGGQDKRSLSPNAVPEIPPFQYGRPAPFSNQWVNWPWNGKDAVYKGAESEVTLSLSRTPPRKVTDWYQKIAQAHPKDPVAQFLWANAALNELQRVPGQFGPAAAALKCLQGVDPGNMREYARLRYVMTLQTEPNKAHPDIERVGDRLLATNPRDGYVKRVMVYDLCNGRNVHKAVRLASEWAASEPKNPEPHAVLAFVYQNLWFRDKSAATKAKAISEYQRFIALAPPADPFRARATYLVGVLKNEKG